MTRRSELGYGRRGGFHYNQGEDFDPGLPQPCRRNQFELNQAHVDYNTLALANSTGSLDVQQPSFLSRDYQNIDPQYLRNSRIDNPYNHDGNTQWPKVGAHEAITPHKRPDNYGRLIEDDHPSMFLPTDQMSPYYGVSSAENPTNDNCSPTTRTVKRRVSKIEEDDSLDDLSSFDHGPGRKRARITGAEDPRATAPENKLRKAALGRKRKITVARPGRKDRGPIPKGQDRNPRGVTRTNSRGQLQWREGLDSDWEAAGYHNDYRQQLIALDRVEGEDYDQKPAGGDESDPLNITSYCHAQRHWTSNKASVRDGNNRRVLHYLDSFDGWVHNPRVDPMRFGDMIMLDHDSFPVRDFQGVPRVLSTHIEPWRLEGLRRCTGMTLADFRARMPSQRMNGEDIKTLQTPQAFTNRMNHWRIAENVGVWLERQGSQPIKQSIKKQLPDPEMKTTETLKSLSSSKQKEVYALNKGRYLNKSRYEQSGQGSIVKESPDDVASNMASQTQHGRRRVLRNAVRKVKKQSGGNSFAAGEPSTLQAADRLDLDNSASTINLDAVKPETATKDDVDYQFWPPANAAQATSIQAALYYTRADYVYWLREEAPVTQVWESYISQYMEIQQQLADRWDHTRGPVPNLMHVGSWVGGWDKWVKPDVSEEELGRLLPG